MIHKCRLIYPYWENPEMLRLQVNNWNRYQGELRDSIRIIVIDDCSKFEAAPILKECKAPVHCYRLDTRWPWNQHQCRNIGAKHAGKDYENFWMFMSDIDIVLTPEMAYTMLTKDLELSKHYTMERTFAPDMIDRKVHPNTFLVKYNTFWRVNGYDLDLIPVGGGGYGGDTQFTKQLAGITRHAHLDDIVLIGYGRRQRGGQPVIQDADTQSLDRSEWHDKYVEALERKRKSGDLRSRDPIRTSYKRVL